MRLRIEPGSTLSGSTTVPGDKSIAHRWLMLAATAEGGSVLRGIPTGLDVLATARCLGALLPASEVASWSGGDLALTGHGFAGLEASGQVLDCTNSGTTMRLLCGLLAGVGGSLTLTGDDSLSARPMDRIAEPLLAMGARISTTDGHAPLSIAGGAELRGITYETPVPSAQVKSAVLMAGVQADGKTTVRESAPSRDHTERALAGLGGPVEVGVGSVGVSRFQHQGFEGDVPGDVSSAAFILGAAAITRSDVAVRDVGLNPTRTHFIEVMNRMGVLIRTRELWESLREPGGLLEVAAGTRLRGTVVAAEELPLVIDEVPVLAALAVHAEGETRFEGAGELRVKESDRLAGLESGLRSLGAEIAVEGDALVVAGGGLSGGVVNAGTDHRLGMALAVAALGATGESVIGDMEWADVSFPGFAETLADLGARTEPV